MTLLAEFSIPFWTITVSALCGISCALPGCFLLLRRMSLLGDAISHGLLPGIALAVLLSGQVGGLPMMLGAMLFGLLTALLAQSLTSFAKVGEDASLGVVFTSLFALGVLLISISRQHLDDCVFFGNASWIALYRYNLGGLEIPQTLVTAVVMLLITAGFLSLLWKELIIASFDPGLGTAMGYSAHLIHYLLIALVAGNTVTSFSLFGSIVVLAMFIVPPATAHLLTDRLAPMLFCSAGLAAASAAVGYWLASPGMLECDVGPMMAVVQGGFLLLAVLFAPRQGLLAKLLRRARLTLRIAAEEILAILYRGEEARTRVASFQLKDHGFSRLTIGLALHNLRRHGMVVQGDQGNWQLTDPGRRQGESIIRSHRLWEAFLGENFDLPLDHLHQPATRMEHFIGPELQRELADVLEKPSTDPHGRAIPPLKDNERQPPAVKTASN
jgi:manganese/zinc/iron transport system permease protein